MVGGEYGEEQGCVARLNRLPLLLALGAALHLKSVEQY